MSNGGLQSLGEFVRSDVKLKSYHCYINGSRVSGLLGFLSMGSG